MLILGKGLVVVVIVVLVVVWFPLVQELLKLLLLLVPFVLPGLWGVLWIQEGREAWLCEFARK